MSTYRLKIVTPDKLFFDDDVERIVTRTTEGDVGILARHAKYVAALDVGELKIHNEGKVRVAAVSEGFITVDNDLTTIVARSCEWAEDIDIERAKEAKQRAESRLKEQSSKKEHDIAELKLKRAINRISIATRLMMM